VSGELDIATVPDLEAAFEQALGTDPPSIVVDLSQVTCIDSTGIRLLLHRHPRGLDRPRPAVAAPRHRRFAGFHAVPSG
jgi:anti-sigma B factor antagonist